MNGATALINTLADCGVAFCIANPGTSEMHLVQALDAVPRMRSVLALYEGVCTGAADGIGRMTGKPAATLLHLGPGLANGIANLHNARRSKAPIINLIGNHPHYHIGFDAPLSSDIDTLARNFSCWIHSCPTAGTLAQDGANAYTASLRQTPGSTGQIATLVMGADATWGEASGPARPNTVPQRARITDEAVKSVARILLGSPCAALLLENHATEQPALEAAGRIAAKTGCRLLSGTFPARVDGGPGRVAVERLPYFPEQILATLKGVEHLILAGSQIPTSFFAYQGIPGQLLPEGCQVTSLSAIEEDSIDALQQLADHLGADDQAVKRFEHSEAMQPTGKLDGTAAIQAISATLPEHVIVCTDSGAGNAAYGCCQNTAPNSWLSLTGGAIGQGGPVATGAALACPERPVLALLGDGGAAYTIQCLWTQAREELNVTTVIFANHSYKILNAEYARLGVEKMGEVAASLFDLGNPQLDWVSLAKGFGVPGARAETAEEFCKLLRHSYRTPGPFLIQVNS